MSPKKKQIQYTQIQDVFPDAKFVEPKKNTFATFFTALLGILFTIVMLVTLITVPIMAGAFFAQDVWNNKLPLEIKIGENMTKTNIYATNSKGENILLGSFFEQDREPVTSSDIPQVVKDAIVSAEDKNFYEHSGVDFHALIRAARANYDSQTVTQGGSSLNQQYIKNVLIQEAENLPNKADREKAITAATAGTIERKVKEARMALYLDRRYSKDDILTGYLNIVSFGGRVYGIKAASEYYYGVEPSKLTLNQAATLMAIVNEPDSLRIDDPTNQENGSENGYALTKKRRDYVLGRMLEDKKITEEQYQNAVAENITPKITEPSTGCETAGGAAYFCDYVTRVILNNDIYGKTYEERENLLKRGGLQIYTTLNLDMQAAAESAMNELPKTSATLEIGGAVSSIETHTGKILAMAQNKIYSNDSELASQDHSYTSINYNANYEYGGSNGFQTGSTFKLFTLLEWFTQGNHIYDNITNDGRITQAKDTCDPTGQWNGDYKFHNASGATYSSGTVYSGTAQSLNTAFIGMAGKLDLCNIVKQANKLGVSRADGKEMFHDPSMVIGTNEIAPMAMANAYGTVANGGTHCNPIAIESITDKNGAKLEVPQADCKKVLNTGITAPVDYILKDIASYGMASQGNPQDGTPMIGKTGTTDYSVDSWLAMSSTNVATVVWMGNTIGKVSLTDMREVDPTQIRFHIVKNTMKVADAIYGGNEFPTVDDRYIR